MPSSPVSFPPVADQLTILRRGVEKIVPEEELAARLEKSRATGTPLRVKYGIDPTGIDVHLGHTVPLRKIRQFQELGHQAVIIIGNYTALVGDPSGRDQTRARLTAEAVERNAADYLTQVGKVVDLSKAEVVRNGDWFGAMQFTDVLELCAKVTVAQLLTREDFANRYKAEQAIFLHECLYPIMQAWDSVKIRADIELGGTEQLYSFMLARDLQREQNMPQQIGMMTPILVGTDGTRRMGKSLGNYIGIGESAYDMVKKFMQVPDGVMRMYFELLTNIPAGEIDTLLAGHPKDAKLALARSVISDYHGLEGATEAAARWQREIGEGGLPSEIPEARLSRTLLDPSGAMQAASLIVKTGLRESSSKAMEAIAQGGAYTISGSGERTPITDRKAFIPVVEGMIVGVGKKALVRVVLGE
jgi:tyrosyl-tRNA synthetase